MLKRLKCVTLALILGWAGLLLLAGAGCQERVVRTTYSPMTGASDTTHPYNRPGYGEATNQRSNSSKDTWVDKTFKGVGDLLFGWTKHFESEPEPKRRYPAPDPSSSPFRTGGSG